MTRRSLWRNASLAEHESHSVDLSTVDDPDARGILDRLIAAGLDIAAWDVTSDTSVPTFKCLLLDPTEELSHVGVGAAANPDSGIALVHALVEAAQVRTTYIIGSREDILPADYEPGVLARRHGEARMLLRAARGRDFRKGRRGGFATGEAEIGFLLDRLRSVGIRQAVSVDLSRPEIGIAVVRVVVPGLEGSDHHGDYSPGRRARARRQARP